MGKSVNDLKSILNAHQIEWNPLFDFGVKTKPFYFGLYKTVHKPGYHSAEKNFEKRLAALIAFLDTLTFSDSSALPQVEKIKSFQAQFNGVVDFHDQAFRNSCRTLLKPLRRLTMSSKNKLYRSAPIEPMVGPEAKKIIDRFSHQLNPNNYSYPYLTYFFYVTEEGVNTLLMDNSRRKSVRRLDDIFELTGYISGLEAPRRLHKTALSYRYALFEENPCYCYKQTLTFKGVNYSTNAGVGYQEEWQKDADETWQCRETFDHWRR